MQLLYRRRVQPAHAPHGTYRRCPGSGYSHKRGHTKSEWCVSNLWVLVYSYHSDYFWSYLNSSLIILLRASDYFNGFLHFSLISAVSE